jgi:uncharacterized membrane protein
VVQVHYIDALIQLINENFATDRSAILPATEAHYKNTLGEMCSTLLFVVVYCLCLLFFLSPFRCFTSLSLAYIRSRQQSPETKEKFSAIQL